MADAEPPVRTARPFAQPASAATAPTSTSVSQMQDLTRVQDGIGEIVAANGSRMDGLLAAVLAVSPGLELDQTLRQIVEAATHLIGARGGTLGVLDQDGMPGRFVTVGMDESTSRRVGALPTGRAVLSAVSDDEVSQGFRDPSAHLASTGVPAGRMPMQTYLGVEVPGRDAVFGRLYLTEKSTGGAFTAEDESLVHALAAAAGIAIENVRLYEGVRTRQRWLEATGEVIVELLDGTDPADALALIAQRASELTDATYTLIALPTDRSAARVEVTELTIAVCTGMGVDSLVGRRIPVSGSTSGAVYLDSVPRRVPFLAHDLPHGPPGGFGPALVLPLGRESSISGVLLAIRAPDGPAFDQRQFDVVASFADQAALALDRAASQSARREVEVLADRDRIARDLHDSVIQRLFAIGLALQSTQRRAASTVVADRLGGHIDQLHEVIQDIRTAIFDLQVRPEGTPGLRRRLHAIVTELTADTAVHTTIRMVGPLDVVPDALADHATSAVREAISNVVRHAHARELSVSVSVDDDLVIDVSDDGIGIAATVARSGLHNLANRAASAGGTFSCSRRAEGGTQLLWGAPLP